MKNTENEKDLLRASEVGDIDELDRLLALGVDVNTRYDDGGDTALLTAISNRHVEFAKALLSAGADYDLQGYNSNTALMVAVQNSYIEEFEMLCQHAEDMALRSLLNSKSFDLLEEFDPELLQQIKIHLDQ